MRKTQNKLVRSGSQRVDGSIFFLRENTEEKNEGNSLFSVVVRGRIVLLIPRRSPEKEKKSSRFRRRVSASMAFVRV